MSKTKDKKKETKDQRRKTKDSYFKKERKEKIMKVNSKTISSFSSAPIASLFQHNKKQISAIVTVLIVIIVFIILVKYDIIDKPDISNEEAIADKIKADVQIKTRKAAGEKGEIQVSGCVQKPTKWEMPMHNKIPGAIFASVASYRDDECKDTVYDMFEKASKPELLFVGVVQQNKKGENAEDCFDSCQLCAEKKRSGHIRVTNFSHLDAKGPTFARYECSKLWRGEEHYMQIDSHIKFEKGWDETLRNQVELTGDKKAAIGSYPPTEEQMKTMRDNNFDTMITMCPNDFDKHGLPTIKAKVVSTKGRKKPLPTGLLSAGLLFFPGEALYKVPYDPYLSYLFFGEETLHSARLWTAGYNIYAPTKAFCVHHYGRESKPRYWDDHKNAHPCKKKAIQRVKYLLGATGKNAVHPDYFLDIDKYGMGDARTLQEYLNFTGIDMPNKKITKSCTVP